MIPGLGNIQKAIENGHRNSWFIHLKLWFSIVMLVYQRVFMCIWITERNQHFFFRKSKVGSGLGMFKFIEHYLHIYIYVDVYTHIYICVCVFTSNIFTYVYTYVNISLYILIYYNLYMHVLHIYINFFYIYTCRFTYVHIHIHYI